MRQIRYRLWSVDPLNPEDERPFSETLTLQACRRVIAVHSLGDDFRRVLIARPEECQIPAGHAYTCQVYAAQSGRIFLRKVRAVDAYAAVRDCIRRFRSGIDQIAVWVYGDDREAGAPPILRVDREGKMWSTRRNAS